MIRFMLNDFLLAVLVTIVFFAVFILGGVAGERSFQKEAVKAGAAYWTVNENGISKFHWITQ